MYTLKIVVKQDDTKGTWAIYRSDNIGSIEWPFYRKCKQGRRPTETQVRRIYGGEKSLHMQIEYRDINGKPL